MVDVEDPDGPLLIVDLVPNAVLAPARSPQSLEGGPQRGTHAMGGVAKRSIDELPRRERR